MKPSHLIPVAALGAALLAAGCGGEATPGRCAQGGRRDDTGAAGRADRVPALPRRRADARRGVHDQPGRHRRAAGHAPGRGVVDDQPDWSPDGKYSPSSAARRGPCSVWTIRADGTDAAKASVRCTLGPICDANSPSWSPTAARRRPRPGPCARHRRRGPDRAVLGRAGRSAAPHPTHDHRPRPLDRRHRRVQRLTPTGARWSTCAGTRWTTKPKGGEALYAMSINGQKHRRLTPWALDAGDHPVLSPDGKTALFRSFAETDDKQIGLLHRAPARPPDHAPDELPRTRWRCRPRTRRMGSGSSTRATASTTRPTSSSCAPTAPSRCR